MMEIFDEMASVHWLTKGDLSSEIKGFLLAAQDQVPEHYTECYVPHSASCVTHKEKLPNI